MLVASRLRQFRLMYNDDAANWPQSYGSHNMTNHTRDDGEANDFLLTWKGSLLRRTIARCDATPHGSDGMVYDIGQGCLAVEFSKTE